MKRPEAEHQHYTRSIKYCEISTDAPAGAFCKMYYLCGISCFVLGAAAVWGIVALWETISMDTFALLFMAAFALAAMIGSFFCLIKIPKVIRAEHRELMEEVEKEWEKQDKKYAAWLKDHPHLEEEEFYEKMRDAGITSIDTEGQKQKLLLCAKNMGIQKAPQVIITAYQVGKQEFERHEQAEAAIDMRRVEKEELKKLLRFSKCQGREKTIRYCEDKIAEYQAIIKKCKQDREKIKNGTMALYQGAKQSETDWATHGGIASAIAGPVAGVSRAVEIQQQNASIRESNRELSRNLGNAQFTMLMAIDDEIEAATNHLNDWYERVQKAGTLLVENVDPNVLFASMKPTLTSHAVSESGAVHVEVTVEKNENLTIFGDTPAVVDGNIEVLILSNTGKTIGTAVCVLPVGGMTRSEKMVIKGLCLGTTKKYDDYRFEIRPGTLWAQENFPLR